MIQEDDVVPPDLVVRDVAVGVGQVLKQRDGIRRTKSSPGKPDQIPLKPRRKAVSSGSRLPPLIANSSRHSPSVRVLGEGVCHSRPPSFVFRKTGRQNLSRVAPSRNSRVP